MKIEKLDKEFIKEVYILCFAIIGGVCTGVCCSTYLHIDDLIVSIFVIIAVGVIGGAYSGLLGSVYGMLMAEMRNTKITWLIVTSIVSIFLGVFLAIPGAYSDNGYVFWCKLIVGLLLAATLLSRGILKVWAFLIALMDRYDY